MKFGVKYFVFIFVLGVNCGYEDLLIFKVKKEVEKYFKVSGLNYIIL